MKLSGVKRNRWLYAILIFMVLALIGFSLLPILTTMVSQNRSDNSQSELTMSGFSVARQTELETQAHGYELVLQREPDNQIALEGLLETKLKLRDLAGTIAPLSKLAELNPDLTDYSILLAQAKEQLEDYEGAAQAYRQILASHPGDMKALNGLVNLFLAQERPEAAIGLVEDTIATAKEVNTDEQVVVEIAALRLLLGQIYANQKQYEKAIATYEQVQENNPDDFRPLLAKALVLQETGKSELAQPLFESSLELAPATYKDQIKALITAAKVDDAPETQE